MGSTVEHWELILVLCDDLGGGDGEGRWEEGSRGGDVCIHRADLHCCATETNETLQSSYPPIKQIAVVVQSPNHVQLFVTPWSVARQASLSFTISWSLLKVMSIKSVMQF